MKNIDYIQKMNYLELADYVTSVFIAGRMYQLHCCDRIDNFDEDDFKLENYSEWLNKERD